MMIYLLSLPARQLRLPLSYLQFSDFVQILSGIHCHACMSTLQFSVTIVGTFAPLFLDAVNVPPLCAYMNAVYEYGNKKQGGSHLGSITQ